MPEKYLVEVHTADPAKPNDTYLYDRTQLEAFLAALAMDDGDYLHITRDDDRTSI